MIWACASSSGREEDVPVNQAEAIVTVIFVVVALALVFFRWYSIQQAGRRR